MYAHHIISVRYAPSVRIQTHGYPFIFFLWVNCLIFLNFLLSSEDCVAAIANSHR